MGDENNEIQKCPPHGQGTVDEINFSELLNKDKKRKGSPIRAQDTKMKKAARKIKKNTSPILTSNRFELLQDEGLMETDNIINEDNTDQGKILKPVPIVVHGSIKTHDGLINKIKSHVKGKFHIKYNRDRINIHTTTIEDYKELLNNIDEGTEFHTYIMKQDKTKAFVIHGLTNNLSTEDLQSELQELGVKAEKCNIMYGTNNPLYMITVKGNANVHMLNQKVKYLVYTKIWWEKYYNKRLITQCHRCQEWGHATTNCHANPKCLKCPSSHLTRECKKSREEPAKCANCEGSHPANSTKCEVYQRRVEWINSHKNRKPIDMAKKSPLQQQQINIHNNKEFPNIRVRGDGTTISKEETVTAIRKVGPSISYKETLINSKHTNRIGNDVQDLNTLFNEMKTLQQLVNVPQMIRLVSELNKKLVECRTPMEKFQVFYDFSIILNNGCE